MSDELLYTSAPRGLKAGSRGFCTVQATAGMPPATATLLESLSGYRHVAAPGDVANPVVWRHVVVTLAGQRRHVLSRLADAGADYTGRTNKLVHHLALDAAELNTAGPAWSQLQPSTHDSAWSGEPRVLRVGRSLNDAVAAPQTCHAWRRATGDAGWGGFLAQRLLGGSNGPISIIYPQDLSPLELISETIALLPERHRWRVTYSTCHTNLPPGVECAWRFVPDGSPEAIELRKRPDLERLDLTGRLGSAPDGPWVEAARSGKRPEATTTPPPSPPARTPVTAYPGPGAALEVDDDADWESDIPGAPPPPPKVKRRARRYPSAQPDRPPSMSAWALASIAAAVLLLLLGVPVAWFLTMGPGRHIVAQYKKAAQVAAEQQESLATTEEQDVPPQAEEKHAEPSLLQPEAASTSKPEANTPEEQVEASPGADAAGSPEDVETDEDRIKREKEELRERRLSLPLFSSSVVYCDLAATDSGSADIDLTELNGIPDPNKVRFLVPSEWAATLVVSKTGSNTLLTQRTGEEGLDARETPLLKVGVTDSKVTLTALGTPTGIAALSNCMVGLQSVTGNATYQVMLAKPIALPSPLAPAERSALSGASLIDWIARDAALKGSNIPEAELNPMIEFLINAVPTRGDLSNCVIPVGDALAIRCVRNSEKNLATLSFCIGRGAKPCIRSLRTVRDLNRYLQESDSWEQAVRVSVVQQQKNELAAKKIELGAGANPSRIQEIRKEVTDFESSIRFFDVTFDEFCRQMSTVISQENDGRPHDTSSTTSPRMVLNSFNIEIWKNSWSKLTSQEWIEKTHFAQLLTDVEQQFRSIGDDYSVVYPVRESNEDWGTKSSYALFSTSRVIPSAAEATPQP